MAIQKLNERQMKACELVALGENNTRVAELVGVNRKTIISWKKDELFMAEVDRQVALLKNKVNEHISMNVEPMMNKLMDIALKSKDESNSLKAIQYALNRWLGMPTSKNEVVAELKNDNNVVEDIDSLILELEEEENKVEDNVIDVEYSKTEDKIIG